jgi:hypothetical protein
MASPEIVPPDLTNAPIVTILFIQIILLHRTIINGKNGERVSPEIVQFLWTILNDAVSRGIALEIADMMVFTVRSLHKYKPVSKTTAHEVVNRLEEQGIVEPTRLKATNPDPRAPCA